MDPTHKYIHWGFRNNLIFYLQFFLWFAAQFQSLSKFIRNWKRIIDKTNQHRAEFGPLRPTERVASQPKKAWTAGCIREKFGFFFAKRTERGGWTAGWFWKIFRVFLQNFLREEVGPRVDFYKVRGLVCKMAGKRKIRAVRRLIRRPGKVSDVACFSGLGIGRES